MLSMAGKWPKGLTQLLFAVQISTIMAQSTLDTNLSPTVLATTLYPSQTSLQTISLSSSPLPRTHTIQVGLADHKMRPETTQAAIGDTIEFAFYPTNHSVVRAEYGSPCIPYEMMGSSRRGFFSGFNPVKEVMDNPPTFRVRVNDAEPILFYCSAPGSCIKYGMVGGINLNSSMSIDVQRQKAMESDFMLQPGESYPEEGPRSSGVSVSSSSTSATASASPLSVANNSSNSHGLSKGAIAGIAVAGACAIIMGGLLFFCWGRTKSLREEVLRRNGPVHQVEAPPGQMAEYKVPNSQVQPLQSHRPSQAYDGFVHQESRTSGRYATQRDSDMSGSGMSGGSEYRISGHPGKLIAPTAMDTAYHDIYAVSPTQGGINQTAQMYTHQEVNGLSPTGSPAPGYYETTNHQQQRQEHDQMMTPVEMDARAPMGGKIQNGK